MVKFHKITLFLFKLIKYKNNRLIKVITSIRRNGKSVLLNNLFYNYLIHSNADIEWTPNSGLFGKRFILISYIYMFFIINNVKLLIIIWGGKKNEKY